MDPPISDQGPGYSRGRGAEWWLKLEAVHASRPNWRATDGEAQRFGPSDREIIFILEGELPCLLKTLARREPL